MGRVTVTGANRAHRPTILAIWSVGLRAAVAARTGASRRVCKPSKMLLHEKCANFFHADRKGTPR